MGGVKTQWSVTPEAQRAWQSMRTLVRFTTADLETTAEVKARTAQDMVNALTRAGYLRCVRPVRFGVPVVRAMFQLVRDTGPLPPLRRRDREGVWDQNRQQLFPFAPDDAGARPVGARR